MLFRTIANAPISQNMMNFVVRLWLKDGPSDVVTLSAEVFNLVFDLDLGFKSLERALNAASGENFTAFKSIKPTTIVMAGLKASINSKDGLYLEGDIQHISTLIFLTHYGVLSLT